MKIMQEEHDAPMVGHRGERTTKVAMGKKFYYLGMKHVVKHFVCTLCQVSKHEIYIKEEIWVI
jgi:hypothetical protein